MSDAEVERFRQQVTAERTGQRFEMGLQPHRVPDFLHQHPTYARELSVWRAYASTSNRIARTGAAKQGSLNEYQTLEAQGGVYRTEWPIAALNAMPTRAPQPARDVNGDGVNDWVYNYGQVADERTDDLSDRTYKTFLKFGGSFDASYYDIVYYAALHPVGDVDGDGYADAVQLDEGNVLLWTGSESGYVATAVTVERGPSDGFVIGSSDFDGDGYADVAIGFREEDDSLQIDVVYGAFDAADVVLQSYDAPLGGEGWPTFGVASLMEDAPGRIVHVEWYVFDRIEMEVLAFEADRTMAVEQTITSTEISHPDGIFLYDGTGDSRREIVIKNWPGQIYAFLALDDGTFEPTPAKIYEDYERDIEPIGDLDGDGAFDYMAHVHYDNRTQGEYDILFGPDDFTDGVEGQWVPLAFADGERGRVDPPQPFFGDLDGDGQDDYLLAINGFEQVGPRLVTSAPNRTVSKQDNTFDQADFTYEEVYETVNVDDWNGDGADDVALLIRRGDAKRRLEGRIELYFDVVQGTPDRVIEAPENLEPVAAAAGDFTGNGKRDLAVAWKVAFAEEYSQFPPPPPSPAVSIYEWEGEGATHTLEFTDLDPDLTYPLGTFETLGVTEVANAGDANDDGIDDLLLGAPDAQVTGYSGKNPFAFLYFGGTSLSTEVDVKLDYSDFPFAAPGRGITGLGDVNGDGIDDFAVMDQSYAASSDVDGAIFVHLGQEEGQEAQFASPDHVLTLEEAGGGAWSIGSNVTSGDFNGDGFADVAAAALSEDISSELIPHLAVFWGGDDVDTAVDEIVEIPMDPLAVEQDPLYPQQLAWYSEVNTVSDLTGNGMDELFFGSTGARFSNALLFAGGSLAPETVLIAPDQKRGLGGDGRADLPWGQNQSAIGDFDGEGILDFVLPQYQDPNFLGSPAYTYHATSTDLPVEFTAFSATLDGDDVRLEWQTASETDNAGFEVQRRLDEKDPWMPLTYVNGAGTTSSPRQYHFLDEQLPYTTATVAYRLRQINVDGAATFSDVVTAHRGTPEEVTLHGTFPNPARHTLTIRYELPEDGPVRLGVYNVLGQHVATLVDDEQAAGRKERILDVSQWSSGAYFLRLTTDRSVRTQRLVVLR